MNISDDMKLSANNLHQSRTRLAKSKLFEIKQGPKLGCQLLREDKFRKKLTCRLSFLLDHCLLNSEDIKSLNPSVLGLNLYRPGN